MPEPDAPTPLDPLNLVARGRRVLRIGYRASGRGIIEFYRSSNLTFASSIAYYSLLSVFPFTLLVGGLFARIAGDERQDALVALIGRALPSQFDFLTNAVRDLGHTSLRFSVVGTLLALWASMGVFGAVTSAVNHAWGVESPYGYFKHKLIAFVMMIAAGVLLMTVLLVAGATDVVGDAALAPAFILVSGLIYYFAPNTTVRLRDVWFGAVLAGLLWRAAFAGFAWYLRAFSRVTLPGSVGTVIAFLVWIYLSAVILLYGVEVTASYARLRKAEENG